MIFGAIPELKRQREAVRNRDCRERPFFYLDCNRRVFTAGMRR